MTTSGTAVGTIVAKNFLSFARVLGRSLRAHHPELPFFVVLADRAEGAFDPAAEPFEILPIDALGIPDLRSMCFRYSRQQVTVAAKPHLLRHLLDRGFTAAMFLDADILVVDRLDPLLAATAAHAVALTPHPQHPSVGCLQRRFRRRLGTRARPPLPFMVRLPELDGDERTPRARHPGGVRAAMKLTDFRITSGLPPTGQDPDSQQPSGAALSLKPRPVYSPAERKD